MRTCELRIGWLLAAGAAVIAAMSACGSAGPPGPWATGAGPSPGVVSARPGWPFVVDPPVPAPALSTSPAAPAPARAAAAHALRATAPRRTPTAHPAAPRLERIGVAPRPEGVGSAPRPDGVGSAPRPDGVGSAPTAVPATVTDPPSPTGGADESGPDPEPICSLTLLPPSPTERQGFPGEVVAVPR